MSTGAYTLTINLIKCRDVKAKFKGLVEGHNVTSSIYSSHHTNSSLFGMGLNTKPRSFDDVGLAGARVSAGIRLGERMGVPSGRAIARTLRLTFGAGFPM